jgi:predicted RNA-binding protein YlxR (DUF448 family)
MLRISSGGGDIVFGRTSRRHDAPGRGAWICSPACIDQAVKRRALDRAWRRKVTDGELDVIRAGARDAFDAMTNESIDVTSTTVTTRTRGMAAGSLAVEDSSTGQRGHGATPRKG